MDVAPEPTWMCLRRVLKQDTALPWRARKTRAPCPVVSCILQFRATLEESDRVVTISAEEYKDP